MSSNIIFSQHYIIVSQEICVKYEKSKAKHRAQFEMMTLELENKVRA